MGKPEDVSPPFGIAITDEQFHALLNKPGYPKYRDELVEVFKRLGAVVRPETKEERDVRLQAGASASAGTFPPKKAQIFVLRKVTDDEFQHALSELRPRYPKWEWPRVSARAWRLFRRLRGDLKDGRTKLSLNEDGTVRTDNLSFIDEETGKLTTKPLPGLPQFPAIREFKPNNGA
jgi:hypothetical protein